MPISGAGNGAGAGVVVIGATVVVLGAAGVVGATVVVVGAAVVGAGVVVVVVEVVVVEVVVVVELVLDVVVGVVDFGFSTLSSFATTGAADAASAGNFALFRLTSIWAAQTRALQILSTKVKVKYLL